MLPNVTMRSAVEAGSNPAGVAAVAVPASVTAIRICDNILDRKSDEFAQVKSIKGKKRRGKIPELPRTTKTRREQLEDEAEEVLT